MGNTAAANAPSTPVAAGEPAFFELSRLMVVAIDSSSNRLVCKAQTKPNGPWETNWTPIDSTNTYTVSASGLTRDGRVAVVGQTPSGKVFYIDETLVQQGGINTWNAPVSLGTPAGPGTITCLSMARDTDGRIEIFALGNGGSIWWVFQNPDQIITKQVTVTPPGTTTPIVVTVQERVPPGNPWSSWTQIPGGLASIVACRQGDGRIALAGINSAGNLYRCVQSTPDAVQASDWTPWVQIDNGATGTFSLVAPIVGPLGSLHLFALSKNGQILHTLQRPAATENWTPWMMPGLSRSGFSALAASLDGDGHLLLAASDNARIHSFNSQTSPTTLAWTGWRDFSNTSWPVQFFLDYNADGRLSLFSHWLLPPANGFGGLWVLSQATVDSTEWEYAWTELAKSNIKQFSVVRDLTPPV